jgi:hypothetical protein
MRSVRDDFWGRYTDYTIVGAKTPRVERSYAVTRTNYGVGGHKPPITANILFRRDLYARCPIDPYWSHGSYEDYEWFWRVVKSGHQVRVCWELFGWHHHRQGIKALIKEYKRSSRGCAYFIRAHTDSPLARRRLLQAVLLPLIATAAVVGLTVGATAGYGRVEAGAIMATIAAMLAYQIIRSRRLEAVGYAATGLTLGLVFTSGLVANLIRASITPDRTIAPDTAPDATAAPVQVRAPAQVLDPATDLKPVGSLRRRPRRYWPFLTAICALQAGLSLTLVRTNTAFTDEADSLWIGRLVIAHWLHGTSWPVADGEHSLQGSPLIYPPLGAVANSLGGLLGARVLSLALMLAATVLLYQTASRLAGPAAAAFAVAIWATSEAALRLAFATPDALSVLLTALSAWLIVQAGHRRRHGELVAAAAVALAMANATSYSGILIDPIVIAMAFFAWQPHLQRRRAAYATGWLTAAWVAALGLLLTFSHSWAGFVHTVAGPSIASAQSVAQVANAIWGYAGLIIVVAVVGAIVAYDSRGGTQVALLGVLAGAALIVPVVQLSLRTTTQLDRHLAYGIWFAAIAAGYGCARFLTWLPGVRSRFLVAFCALALAYPAAAGWRAAWDSYHGWPNAHSFIARFTSAAAASNGPLFAGNQVHVAEYYTPGVPDWTRWTTGGLSLNPGGAGPNVQYYKALLDSRKYGVIALVYATSFTSANLPPTIARPGQSAQVTQDLLRLVSANSGEPGLRDLTRALQQEPAYQIVASGPYDSALDQGIFVIWRRVGP